MKAGPKEFADFETELHARLMEVEREVVGAVMAEADVEAEVIEVEGRTLRRGIRSAETYMTAAGPVRVERYLHRDRADPGAQAVVAMDLKLGVVDGFWTPLAAKQAAWVVTQMTPSTAAELFVRVGNMRPSKASLDRLPKTLSDRWEEDRAEHEAALREALVVPEGTVTVAVSIDGVMAPMEGTNPVAKRAETASRGRVAKGPTGYQEIGCATLSFCDKDGEMLAAVRMARAPEPKKATLKSMVFAELAAVLKAAPGLRVAKIADAGGDNFAFLSKHLPEGEEILDFFHATEHLHGALGEAYGDGTLRARQAFERLRLTLLEDEKGVAKVIESVRYLRTKHPRNARLKTELAYFRKNRHRMRYAAWKRAGIPIGSGVVEAACKTLVAQRLKLSGMRWGKRGAQAILTLRGWDQSERFDLAWARLAATYHHEVHVVANVVPIDRNARK